MEKNFSKYHCTFYAVVTIMMADANPTAVSREHGRFPVEERETSESTSFGSVLGGRGR
jgi:hypothetical protein